MRQTSLVFAGLLALASAKNLRNLKRDEPEQVYFNDAKSEGKEDGADGGRVVGGVQVPPGLLPFYGHFEGSIMCGGALIHEDIFITAAHCLEKGHPSTIRIGATTTTSENEGQSVAVCSGIIHPNNNMKSMENDIAILKLCDPVFVNSYAEYNTNPQYPSATGTDLFMVGFGRTDVSGTLSPILHTAKTEYLNEQVCTQRYNKYNGEQVFCADAPTTGICYGDSGGPVLDEANVVVGLNSYIVDTCNSEYPDFFTRISSYASWLDQMVCDEAFNPPRSCANGSGGGGTPSQGDDEDEDDDDAGDNPTDILTECLTGIIGFFQSLLGGR